MNAQRNWKLAAPWLPLALLAGLAGCGGGGGGGGGGSNQPPASALGLAVEPTSVLLGQSAELTWSASDGSSCSASGGWSGAQPASGTSTVTPTATGAVTYTLSCSGGGYTSDVTETVTLQVSATATLTQLQASIFTPRCAVCHDGSQPAGGALPGSMNLTAGNSFASLVGVASLEQAAVPRVAPGDPDASYVVRKVEGAAGITGDRMPLGGPFLDAATIDQLRAWIAAGAANN